MKRLTDERIEALIDMAPLNETIVDIKSALVELQERRKAAGEQAGLFIRVNNMFFQVATAGNDCDESIRDQAIPLYTEPQPAPIAPDLSGIDMTNIFEDEELEMMSHGNNPRSNAYRELLAFRKAMGNQAPVRQPAGNSAAIAELARIISTAGSDPSEITDAVWEAGYRKPERTEEEAINLAIDTFTDSRYNGIPDDAWPKTYDEILQCELNEIIDEVTWSYFSPENIANRLIEAGYSLENAND